MRSLKKNLLTVIVVFFCLIVFFGLTEGLYYLFLFPIIALIAFVSFYLYKQSQKDTEILIKRSAQFAAEDAEAEKWVEKSLAPNTLKIIKAKRFSVIIYSALLFLSITFLWSYLGNGLLVAIRNFTYAAILLLLFIMYVLTAPSAFEEMHSLLPKKLQNYVEGDWVRGYFFLFPITFVLYLLYPFTSLGTQLVTKLMTFPLFFLIYSAFFICVYCITYIYQDIHKDDEKKLKEEVKEMLDQEQ